MTSTRFASCFAGALCALLSACSVSTSAGTPDGGPPEASPTPLASPDASADPTPEATPEMSPEPTPVATTPVPGESCDLVQWHFEQQLPQMRECQSAEDCRVETGICATFMNACYYAIHADAVEEFQAIRQRVIDLECQPEGVACAPCPPAEPTQCIAGRCELGCEYVCNMDCECERDERGCDLPRCAAPEVACPDGDECSTQSAWISQLCVPETIRRDEGGQLLVEVVDELAPCTGEPLPCEARLEDGVLRVDPFYSVPFLEETVDCQPRRVVHSCVAPALPEGNYAVDVNNVHAGFVEVVNSELASVSHCFRLEAPEDDYECQIRQNGELAPTCRYDLAAAGTHISLPVGKDCVGCFDRPGPCGVSVYENLIAVTPRYLGCSCHNCGVCAGCPDIRQRCVLPPLAPGDYVLSIAGEEDREIRVGEGGATSCEP